MNAEIIAIGTEILLGDIVNTNAQYISKELASLGISVYHQTVVGDNSDRLYQILDTVIKRADIVITTGGLGPTKDDLSKETAAKLFNKKLIEDKRAMQSIINYFAKMNIEVSENNNKQALLPEGAKVLYNDKGTAPGFILNENGKILIMLPGPPREMIPMFQKGVKQYLKDLTNDILVSKVLKICGIGEGHMEEKIKDIIEKQTNPTVAPYAKQGEVILRITAKAKTEEQAYELMKPVKKEIYSRLGMDIYGEDDDTLESVVGGILIKNNFKIAIAESCSGGLLSGKLINFPGISKVFMEGIITYSNNAKMKYLDVKSETLEQYGAVSQQTAKEMAEGVAKKADTNIGLSVTGIAGPTGGTAEKPVGLVYIGVYINGKVKVKKIKCVGDRQKIRNITVIKALDFLRRELLTMEA